MRRIFTILVAAIAALSLAACSATFTNQGHVPPEDQLDQLMVGIDTRETVEATIGAPGTSGLLADGTWYYVQSRYRHFAYKEPEEIDREVVAISFDERGLLENIERFGLEDGRVVVLSRRVTKSSIREPGLLKRLFGNFGRVDLGEIL